MHDCATKAHDHAAGPEAVHGCAHGRASCVCMDAQPCTLEARLCVAFAITT